MFCDIVNDFASVFSVEMEVLIHVYFYTAQIMAVFWGELQESRVAFCFERKFNSIPQVLAVRTFVPRPEGNVSKHKLCKSSTVITDNAIAKHHIN